MLLIVDANVVLSALIPGSKSIDLLTKLEKTGYKFFSPEFLLEEVNKNIPSLVKTSGLTREELQAAFTLLLKRIEIISKSEYEEFLLEAKRVSPDVKDVPYFALAIKMKCPLWSREPRLKRQKAVKVLDDKDVEELLK